MHAVLSDSLSMGWRDRVDWRLGLEGLLVVNVSSWREVSDWMKHGRFGMKVSCDRCMIPT
jgi:hypothetical protein